MAYCLDASESIVNTGLPRPNDVYFPKTPLYRRLVIHYLHDCIRLYACLYLAFKECFAKEKGDLKFTSNAKDSCDDVLLSLS